MTPHQTLAVAVRLFAIWLALYALRELVGAYLAGRERSDPYILPVVAAVSAVTILLVITLWLFPKSIARGLLPLKDDGPVRPASQDTWLIVGSSLIGLWLVASAGPGLFRNLFVMFVFRSENVDMTGVVSGVVYLFAQVAVGAVLIFGANSIRRFILWARYAGPE